MKKKVILRTLIGALFFSILIFIYLKINYKEEEKIVVVEKKENDFIEEQIESSNIIEDVSYSAKDTKGNEYFLKASEGIIDLNETDIIFLKSVKAIINLNNYKQIEISSDFGKHNINNYDTIFSKNVIIKYLDNLIEGEYLDFSWNKNLMIISRDVTLKNNKSSLRADVLEVNIETKDIKIFMYEENKKVNIRNKKYPNGDN